MSERWVRLIRWTGYERKACIYPFALCAAALGVWLRPRGGGALLHSHDPRRSPDRIPLTLLRFHIVSGHVWSHRSGDWLSEEAHYSNSIRQTRVKWQMLKLTYTEHGKSEILSGKQCIICSTCCFLRLKSKTCYTTAIHSQVECVTEMLNTGNLI